MAGTMTKISEGKKAQVAWWLSDRWMIAHTDYATPADMSYYEGAVRAIEKLGLDWERDSEGNHRIF